MARFPRRHSPATRSSPGGLGARGRLRRRLFSGGELPLEQRLFRLLCLTGVFVTLGGVLPTNVLSHLPWQLNLTVASFGLVCLGLYALARKGRYLTCALFLALMVVLDISWFQNAGSHGSIGMFLFTASMLLTIFFRGPLRWTLLLLFLANGFVLIGLDAAYPHLARPYPSPTDRLPDLLSGFFVSTLACVVMVWVVLESHDRERERLAQANARLEQSLQEIRTLQGLLPICAWCKKVRTDEGLWLQMERYLTEHSEASFTHGICPDCAEAHRAELEQRKSDQRA